MEGSRKERGVERRFEGRGRDKIARQCDANHPSRDRPFRNPNVGPRFTLVFFSALVRIFSSTVPAATILYLRKQTQRAKREVRGMIGMIRMTR